MEKTDSFLETNKKFFIPIVVLLGILIVCIVLYFTVTYIQSYSENATSFTPTPSPTKKNTGFLSNTINILTGQNDVNVARNVAVSENTNSPEGSSPTINPNQELMFNTSKALKSLIPVDIYSEFWCADVFDNRGTNIVNRNFKCVIRKIIAKELNITRNELNFDDCIKVCETPSLCEKISALGLIDFLGRLSTRPLKYTNENNIIVFSYDKYENGNYEKIFSWDEKNERLRSYNSLYDEFTRYQLFIRENFLNTLNTPTPGLPLIPRKLSEYIVEVNPADMSNTDFGKFMVLFTINNGFSIHCIPCMSRNNETPGM